MKRRDELDAARAMEADCTIGAGAGFGKYTREIAERLRQRKVVRILIDTAADGFGPVRRERDIVN